MEVVNVTSDGLELNFNGRSHVAIASFNNVDYTRGLAIIFKFKEAETAKPTERQVLLSNCDNSTNSHSIEIALEGKYVKFTIDVGENTYFQTNVEYVVSGRVTVSAGELTSSMISQNLRFQS